MIRRLASRWEGFFLYPASAFDLAVCRILFFAGLFCMQVRRDYAPWALLPQELWQPQGAFALLGLPRISASAMTVLHACWLVSLLSSCLGLATRWSTAAAFALGFYFWGMPESFGYTSHGNLFPLLACFVLMLSRCGDALSIDASLAGRQPPPSGEYTWPIKLICCLMALTFMAAGLSKLCRSGLEWIFSDSLATILLRAPLRYSADRLLPVEWIDALARQSWLCQGLAGATVLLELAMPLALFSRRACWLLLPSMMLAQLGFQFLVGPAFMALVLGYLFWMPWGKILDPLQRAAGSARGWFAAVQLFPWDRTGRRTARPPARHRSH